MSVWTRSGSCFGPAPGTISFVQSWHERTPVGGVDAFVGFARRIAESEGFEEWGVRAYKLRLAGSLEGVRESLLAADDGWRDRQLAVLGDRENNLVDWRWRDNIKRLTATGWEEFGPALRGLWSSGGSGQARLRSFQASVPSSVARTPGDMLRVGSFLVGAGVEQVVANPPVHFEFQREAWKVLGYPPARAGADAAEIYGRALANLDQFIDDCEERDFEVLDRLDAQGIIWAVLNAEVGDPPMKDWTDEDIQALWNFRSH